MKHLAALFFVALVSSAQAQTTNITLSALVEEPNRTNTMVVVCSAKEVRGFNVNWAVAQLKDTNTPPTFRKSVQDWMKDALVPLQAQADADEQRSIKVDLIKLNLDFWWASMNSSEKDSWRALSSNMVVKYGPVP